MWIMTNKAFLSIVADRDAKEFLWVRARAPGHIEAHFKGVKVEKTEDADYLFRALVHKTKVMEVVAANIDNIRYTNFKNSVLDRKLHDVYLSVWNIMYSFQRTFMPPRPHLRMSRLEMIGGREPNRPAPPSFKADTSVKETRRVVVQDLMKKVATKAHKGRKGVITK